MTDNSPYPPLEVETVQQLRTQGWSEEKIAKAARRKEMRNDPFVQSAAESIAQRTGCTMREAYREVFNEQSD